MNGTHIKKEVYSHSCTEKAPTRASIHTHTHTHTHTHKVHESEISRGAGGGAPFCLPFRTAPLQLKVPKFSVIPPAPSEVKVSRRKPS